MSAMAAKQTGFTIVELLIVIVVIAILATISIVAYSGVQARARDSIRKQDLAKIKKALALYHVDNGNWMEDGSGCGNGGTGTGWFNYVNGTTYVTSISACLTNAGYTSKDIIDPSGGKTATASSGYAYFKGQCGTGDAERVYIYAKLETLPTGDTATDGTCNTTIDTSYGMNYYVQVQ